MTVIPVHPTRTPDRRFGTPPAPQASFADLLAPGPAAAPAVTQQAYGFSQLGMFGTHQAVAFAGSSPNARTGASVKAASPGQVALPPPALNAPAVALSQREAIADGEAQIENGHEGAVVSELGLVLSGPAPTEPAQAAPSLLQRIFAGRAEDADGLATTEQAAMVQVRPFPAPPASPAPSLSVIVTQSEAGLQVVAASPELSPDERQRLLTRAVQVGAEFGVTVPSLRHNGSRVGRASNNQGGG